MICANCGFKLVENARFCANCGTEEKEVKIWKSVVAIVAIVVLIIGGIILGILWLFNIVPFGYEPYRSAMTEFDYDEPEHIETPPNEETADGEMQIGSENAVSISTRQLAANLREEFDGDQNFDFQPPLINLARNHEFTLDVAFEARYGDIENLLAVYIDSELTERMFVEREILRHSDDPEIPEGHSRIIIRPDLWPAGRVRSSFHDLALFDPDVPGSGMHVLPHSGTQFLHEMEEGESWGFLRHFYLVSRMDIHGNTHRRPQVTIFTLEAQLEAPQSEFFVTEEGIGGFRWNEVPGADFYVIVQVDATRVGAESTPIGKTTETSWVAPMHISRHEWTYGSVISMNRAFSNWTTDVFFSVIAVNSQTHSSLGNLHNGATILSTLPTQWDWEDINALETRGTGETIGFIIPDFNGMPTHLPLEMLDDSIIYRRVVYNWDAAETNEMWYNLYAYREQALIDEFMEGVDLAEGWPEDEWNAFTAELEERRQNDPSIWTIVSTQTLELPFVLEGTPFDGVIIIRDIDLDSYRQELVAARQRIEEAAPRGGGTIAVDLSTGQAEEDEEEEPPPRNEDDDSQTILIHPGDRSYANSALSAFLAYNLLAGNTRIDLTYFPESANLEYLWDAFNEALYQNPLILHFSEARFWPGSNLLTVRYRESADTIRQQQAALRQILPDIITEIITEGMSDLEKSMAINRFLVETNEYDWAALEEAERNNFRFVDSRYYNSFTAYGTLINRVSVCAGIAAAYKLLADEAGLESIVVIGYLEGFLPHAWNRVNINGHWHTIDVTNNAIPNLFNIFLHLPDEIAAIALVESTQFVLDDFLPYYRSADGGSEYFYITDRFYTMDTIASALARDIRETGSATLRTDASLCDFQFGIILWEVSMLLDTSNLVGSHMLGVIWISQ